MDEVKFNDRKTVARPQSAVQSPANTTQKSVVDNSRQNHSIAKSIPDNLKKFVYPYLQKMNPVDAKTLTDFLKTKASSPDLDLRDLYSQVDALPWKARLKAVAKSVLKNLEIDSQ